MLADPHPDASPPNYGFWLIGIVAESKTVPFINTGAPSVSYLTSGVPAYLTATTTWYERPAFVTNSPSILR